MRKRLTGLLQRANNRVRLNLLPFEYEELADYLLENNVVVLPCKVGSTVYYIGYLPCHQGETLPDSYGCCGCEDECDLEQIVIEKTVPSLTFIVDKFIDHYGDYFLTREEAERVLSGEK